MTIEVLRDPLWDSLEFARDRLLVAMTEVERGDFLAAAVEIDQAAKRLRDVAEELRAA